MKLRKLDRYILAEVLKPFIATSVAFFFIFFMFQMLRLSDYLIVHKAPLPWVMEITLYLLLSFSPLVFPVAFLTSVLIGFGRLSADSELVAIKSAGIGVNRMIAPVLGLAAVVSMLSLAMSLAWAPWGERSMTAGLVRVGSAKVMTSLQEGTFNVGFFDLLLYAERIDASSGHLKRVFLFDEREPAFPVTVVAREGLLQKLSDSSAAGAQSRPSGQFLLTLHDGSLHRQDPRDETHERMDFSRYSLYLSVGGFGAADLGRPRMLSYRTLVSGMRDPGSDRQRYLDYATELWKRIHTSLAPLIFCFLGAGFGVVRTRAVQSRGFVITFLTMLVYWESLTIAVTLATQGTLDPGIAMTLPSLAVGVAAFFAFKRASW